MQTFLPYSDFQQSAAALDNRRLGKQRVETLQILQAIQDGGTRKLSSWANHPAAKMWRGYEIALADYGIACCEEWQNRQYVDTLLIRFKEWLSTLKGLNKPGTKPPWLTPRFTSTHRIALLVKWTQDRDSHTPESAVHRDVAPRLKKYRRLWLPPSQLIPDTYEYWWPIQDKDKEKAKTVR